MALSIDGFYGDDKSIQRSYTFEVDIINDNSPGRNFLPDGESMPEIKNFHVLNVVIPQWSFKREIQYHGPFPRSFAVLDHDGFELKISFEEDDVGTIAKLIDWMQRRIFMRDGSGRYVPPGKNKIALIVVKVLDAAKNVVYIFKFPDCYFLKASEPTFDYATNESIKYEIVFGTDFQKFEAVVPVPNNLI